MPEVEPEKRADPPVPLEVFISHSTRDQELAGSLMELLKAALNLTTGSILCTSSPGHGILPGENIEERVRSGAQHARLVLWLVSPDSLRSPWVMYEVAPRFDKRLPLVPVVAPGQPASLVPEPFNRLDSAGTDNRDALNEMITAVAKKLGISRQAPESYEKHLQAVLRLAETIRSSSGPSEGNGRAPLKPVPPKPAKMVVRWIGLSFAVVYLLNGLAAPTYIRGQLYQVRERGKGKEVVSGNSVWVGGTKTTSNEDGWWTVPLQGAGFPRKIRVEIQMPGSAERLETSLWGPWPAFTVFKPFEDVYVLHPYEQGDARLVRRAALPLERPPSAGAAWALPFPKKPPAITPLLSPQPAGAVLGKGFAARYEFGFFLRKVKYGDVSGFVVRSNRAYLRVRVGKKELAPKEIILPGVEGFPDRRMMFPTQSNPESWLPATAWKTEAFENLFCRLTSYFSPILVGKGWRWDINQPVHLELVGNRGDILGEFDLTAALRQPGSQTLIPDQQKRGSEVLIENYDAVASVLKQFLMAPYRLDWLPEKLTLSPGQTAQVKIKLNDPAPLTMEVQLTLKKGTMKHPPSIRIDRGQKESLLFAITAGKTAGKASIEARLPDQVGGDDGDLDVKIQ